MCIPSSRFSSWLEVPDKPHKEGVEEASWLDKQTTSIIPFQHEGEVALLYLTENTLWLFATSFFLPTELVTGEGLNVD